MGAIRRYEVEVFVLNRKTSCFLLFMLYAVGLLIVFSTVVKGALNVRGAWFFYYFPLLIAGLLVMMLSGPFRRSWT